MGAIYTEARLTSKMLAAIAKLQDAPAGGASPYELGVNRNSLEALVNRGIVKADYSKPGAFASPRVNTYYRLNLDNEMARKHIKAALKFTTNVEP